MLALAPEVVEAATAGDSQAVDRLVTTAVPLVLGWCRRLGGPRVDPDEAAQDVLERVLVRIHTLENPERLEAWLYGITRRRLADLRRLRWVQRWMPGLVIDVESDDPNPERLAGLSEASAKVQLALDDMAPKYREVLVLFYVEGRTAAEIGTMLDLPTNTVKSRLITARGRFHVQARSQGLVPRLVEVPS